MEIPLSRGLVAIIDDDDFDLVRGFKWHVLDNRGYLYAFSGKKKDSKPVLMHRLILGVEKNRIVDHIDGNGLNNQRSNLRECSSFENMQNRKLHKNSRSGFKNVWQEMVNGRLQWKATVKHNNKRHRKTFQTPEDAYAWAVNKRMELHGEFFYDPQTDSRNK